jgi:hypothetical protein
MATTDKDKPAKTRKAFEAKFVVYTKKGERRAPGATVYEDEIDNAADHVSSGVLIDPDAPLPPTLAGKQAVHDELTSIAIDGGLLTRAGATYTLGEKTVGGGIEAYRAAITVEELHTAIVAKLTKAAAE